MFSVTRVGKYHRLFSDLAKCQIANTLDEFLHIYTFEEWVNAAHEAAEIIRIHEGLQRVNDLTLTSRLRDALSGHELFVLDSDDRSGRDFTFELAVAAKFARRGYEINFGADADVEAVVMGTEVYVECKRLKSANKIQRRVKEGLKQLSRRYDSSAAPAAARGILALSIGKTVNSSLKLLEADDATQLAAKASMLHDTFIGTYGRNWQEASDQRTLGVFIVLDTPARLIAENKLATVHETAVNNCVPRDTEGYQLLLQIANNVFDKRK